MIKRLIVILILLFYIIFCTAFTPLLNNININADVLQLKIFENIATNIVKKDNNNEEFIPTITINKNETVIGDTTLLRYNITEKEFSEFVRVVEAEVTGDYPFGVSYEESYKSKLRVAQVILNRVESSDFPDTIHGVIFQKNAFTPLLDGRYYSVEISQVTIDACKDALLLTTEDITYGCEFFKSGPKECKYGSYVFTDSVGHSFFKSYHK